VKVSPTTIFCWKSYGDISIYLIDTQAKYDSLLQEIAGVATQLGFEPMDESMTITGIISSVGGLDTHESFESGTGWKTLKYKELT
jgi:hypothetical protein